ncbi:MAG: NAD(P)/FAD-dependent oxidoreductase [Planctomycetota bacterium]|jgi:glycine/D-amino acid oxidase-like deaminating enzyme
MRTPTRPDTAPGADTAYDVAIIGAGIAGLSLACELARRGVTRVAVFEAERASARHSSGLNAAILRTVIDEPEIAALADRAHGFFFDPPQAFGTHALARPVGLVLTADEPEAARRLERVAADSPRPIRALDSAELREHAPFLATQARTAWLVPDDGVLDISSLSDGYERWARELGVRFHFDSAVETIVARDRGVTSIQLSRGHEVRAECVVVAAGGWSARLAASAGSSVRLSPRRRHLLVTSSDPRVDPDWPVVWNTGDEFYARPESGGLLLCACDEAEVDPDRCEVDLGVRERIAGVAGRHLPQFADAAAAHLWCGMRTFADDHRFTIGWDADVGGLFWVAGLGGHGMSTAPAVAQLAADALLGAPLDSGLSAFEPGRHADSVEARS